MTDPTALPNYPPPPDEHPLRGRVLDVAVDLALAPTIDDDGDVSFVVPTEPPQTLFARCQDGDLPVLRVFGQWQLGDAVPDDLLLRLQRCNDFSLQLHVAKLGIAGGNLVVMADHVVPVGVDLATIFRLSIDLVLQVVEAWHRSFDEGRPEAPTEGGS